MKFEELNTNCNFEAYEILDTNFCEFYNIISTVSHTHCRNSKNKEEE